MGNTIYEVELSVYICGDGEVFHDVTTFSEKKEAIKFAKQWKKENDNDDCTVTIYETIRKNISF